MMITNVECIHHISICLFYIMDPLDYECIVKYLKSGEYPSDYGKAEKRELRRKTSRFRYLEGKLVKAIQDQNLFVIQKNEVDDVLKEVHDNSGHQCSRYTYKIAKDRYYWPNMLKSGLGFVRPKLVLDGTVDKTWFKPV